MPNCLKNDVILVRYPFSDLTASKIRPAIVVNEPHVSKDSLIVPLTSRTHTLLPGEFVFADWKAAGLNVPSAVKRGIYTVHSRLLLKSIGQLSAQDFRRLDRSIREWLGLG